MKHLVLLVGCLIIGLGLGLGVARPARPFAQPNPTPSDQPFSRANTVLARTTAPPDSVLDCLVHHLQREGFSVDTIDRARGLVTTKVELPAANLPGDMKIRAVRVGSEWKLTGTYVIEAYGSGVAYPAEFWGMSMMPAKTTFRLVEETARAIPRARLRYVRGKVRFGVMTKLDVALKSTW